MFWLHGRRIRCVYALSFGSEMHRPVLSPFSASWNRLSGPPELDLSPLMLTASKSWSLRAFEKYCTTTGVPDFGVPGGTAHTRVVSSSCWSPQPLAASLTRQPY